MIKELQAFGDFTLQLHNLDSKYLLFTVSQKYDHDPIYHIQWVNTQFYTMFL